MAVTLRHLVSGAKYRDMQYAWGMPKDTISKVVREVCEAIHDEYDDELMTPPGTEQGWREMSDEWYRKWNFPHTVGAIGGKHVACKGPPKTGSEYLNYKGFSSVILFAMVDADYKFVWADVYGNGVQSDAQIWNASELKAGLLNGDIMGWPRPEPLPHDTEDVPYFLVGDDAFALRTYLMKPYATEYLTREQRTFNYRLSRARLVVENSFGILANRFRVLLGTMEHHPATIRLITKACLLLHNMMRTRYPTMQNRLVDVQKGEGVVLPGAWRQGPNLLDTSVVAAPNICSTQRRKHPTKEATYQRNLIRLWLCSPAGAVPWQDSML